MMNKCLAIAGILLSVEFLITAPSALGADPSAVRIDPVFRAVDLDVGQSADVKLSNGKTVTVKLLSVAEQRCEMRNAVRRAVACVEVGSRRVELASSMYNLPKTVGKVQIDCPVTRGYVTGSKSNVWALDKAARFRLWPAGSPWVRPGTLGYPVNQRWFASDTQMGNDPCYVNACDIPGKQSVYYHYGLDFGGAEGMVDVLAAAGGVVVSRGGKTTPGTHHSQVSARYDVVYIRDDRGWYHRYSHMLKIEDSLKLGQRVKMGQKIGLLGKEGGSGGWSHLHFGISAPQPSGRYGSIDGYAMVFDAYRRRYGSKMIAVARPHQVAWAGKPVTLDANRSWHSGGIKHISKYEWRFTDGKTATGTRVAHTYAKPGHYTELLKITDDAGRVDYDFAVVQVFDKVKPLPPPPAIHAACWPTTGVKVGDEVTFKVRSFGVKPYEGRETWDFGDGTKPAYTRSDGNINKLAKNGYAVTTHRYAKPGHYFVTVSRTNNRGQTATGRLHLTVAPRVSPGRRTPL
jgi:murein DD-endopeptidase MepM/ murein hydrolase activator NlpD